MSLLDAVLVVAAAFVGTCLLFKPWAKTPQRLALAGATLALLAVAQLVVEGFALRFAPVWLLAALTAASARWRPASRAGGWTVRSLAVALVGVTIVPWLAAPLVPQLPTPTGPLAVGTHIFRWVDPARPEAAKPGERRNVVAQLWYPAAPRGGRAPPYIDGLGRLPSSVSGLPRQLMGAYGRIDVHAQGDAPMAPDRPHWPLILFSPGAEATRAFYSGLAAELASHGFAVAVLDHPYESAVTQLADGRIATDAHRFASVANDPLRAQAFMAAEQGVRAADLRFTLDQLGREPGWRDRLTLDHVTAAGHSFGGASAIELWTQEPRVAGVVNLDGTLYGDPAAGHARGGRVLLVESDDKLTPHGTKYKVGIARLREGLGRAPETVGIPGASHFSFTDGPAFLAWPAHVVLPQLFGRRAAAEVQRIAAERIAAVAESPAHP